MAEFIKGLELSRDFFLDIAKPILDRHYPDLEYSAGLIGYGSDVLGYDDEVSRDHMWGPRFYLFLKPEDAVKKQKIMDTFSETLPYRYKGYSVNFSEPDPNDNGVRHAKFIDSGKVNPLIFIQTFEEFLIERIGIADLSGLQPVDWLTFSEHRLLSLVSGTMFIDKLKVMDRISPLKYYPKDVKAYLIASNWNIIASEQAFVRRCGECGDETGSVIICARIAERLMRLCFLYTDTYAPYSKWFGTAFDRLSAGGKSASLPSGREAADCGGVPQLSASQSFDSLLAGIRELINSALHAPSLARREDSLVRAQAMAAAMHNASGLTDYVDYEIESYFGRNIKVIFADKFAQAMSEKLKGTAFENIPLIGSLSQVGGLSDISDDCRFQEKIRRLYE
ncbi:MAG: DUF4037 domain-containing protein [Lachnospiraceae bacterium]|jgi:hypothetical protein|nr:DUF4037 domain-containing protein [Lachnospiraceae bacterium]